nr:LysR substrate-binding domain-containing protein [Paracoccus marinaquae]
MRHAPEFLQSWQRLQRHVTASGRHVALATIGGEINLWQPTVLNWAAALRRQRPDIALHIEIDKPQNLIENLAAGRVDAAVLHAPPPRPGVKLDLLLNEKLVLVTTDPGADPLDEGRFFSVDWGPEFLREFTAGFPDLPVPAVAVNLGRFALKYVLDNGGAGYFRGHVVDPYIHAGRLHRVPGAPSFAYPIYVASCADADPAILAPVVACLRQTAATGFGK